MCVNGISFCTCSGGLNVPLSFPSQSIFNAQHSAVRDHEPEHVSRATWGARCGYLICLLHRDVRPLVSELWNHMLRYSEKPLTRVGQVGCLLAKTVARLKIGLNRCSSALNYGWQGPDNLVFECGLTSPLIKCCSIDNDELTYQITHGKYEEVKSNGLSKSILFLVAYKQVKFICFKVSVEISFVVNN